MRIILVMADFVGATRVVARRSALQRLITNSFCGTTMTHGGHDKDRHPDVRRQKAVLFEFPPHPRGSPLQ